VVITWRTCYSWQRLSFASMNHGIYLVIKIDICISCMLMSECFVNVACTYVCVDKSIMKSDDQAWYFFCPRELKNSNRKWSNRRTKAGFWKSTCQGKLIKAKHTKKVIGIRKTLVFHEKAGPKAKRTGWIIDEYDNITDSSLSKEVNANFNLHG